MKSTILLFSSIFFLASGLSNESNAQLFVKVNYNFFNMNDLKNVQEQILSDLTSQGIEARITDSYPAYWGFQGGLLFPLDPDNERSLSLGGFFEHTSTGGRIHYSDYSGELKSDQLAKATSIGGIVSIRAVNQELFAMDVQLNARLIFSSLDLEFLTRIGNESQTEKYSFSSFSFGVEPGIVPYIKLGGFNFGLSLSYLLSIATSLEYDNYSNAYLTNNNGDKVSIDWSGFKLGALVKYSF